ncbi:pancreatic triacylglycerol lipase-like [Tachypleus tridentatus]|uniref:pancreatic triacylglycerol lipase-like n=1 Tax=Tachypleus tridentatus TaxID=6853 RepID=UPI003FD1F6F6
MLKPQWLHFNFLLVFTTIWIQGLAAVDFHKLYQNNETFHGEKIKCIDELGCFGTGGVFFHPLFRPVSVLPDDREVINVQFNLYTRERSKDERVLKSSDKNSVLKSEFSANRPTKFIVHGYIDNKLFGVWMKDMKDEFLLSGDFNVIIVDWSGGNKLPYYQATANTRVVGAEIALLISRLEEWAALKPEDCHIVGHSLGSHIAGYAGERLNRLGRITAVDPAEPFFQNMPVEVRIDPSDALFVDVIHSDAKTIFLMGLGMSQTVGHVDFFPNDGTNQPGCKSDQILSFIIDGLNEGMRRFVSCNHQRAVDFFHHSINSHRCVPVGYACQDWETFLQGRCVDCGVDGSRCAVMGLRAETFKAHKDDSKSVKMYIKTSGLSPFCLFHYQVIMKLFKPSKSRDERGHLYLSLKGDEGDVDFTLSDDLEEFYHGAQYTYLVTTDKYIGDITKIGFSWKHHSTIFNPLTWILFRKPRLYVEYIKVTPMNEIDNTARQKRTKRTCGSENDPLYSGDKVSMEAKTSC